MNDPRIVLKPGTELVSGNYTYEIIEHIGGGGSSLIYSAQRQDFPLKFALKECYPHPESGNFSYTRENFRVVPDCPQNTKEYEDAAAVYEQMKEIVLERESKISAELSNSNPYIVPIHDPIGKAAIIDPPRDSWEVNNGFALMMSLEEKAQSFRQVLERLESYPINQSLSRYGGNIPLLISVKLIRSVLKALKGVHNISPDRPGLKSYIHGDIQFGNVFLIGCDYAANDLGEAVIIDFGSACELVDRQKTVHMKRKDIFSTVGYRAPEIINAKDDDDLELTAAADVYSVCCLLHRFVFGAKPVDFMERTVWAYHNVREVPSVRAQEIGCNDAALNLLNAIFKKGMMRLPEKRYQNANDLDSAMEELEKALSSKHTIWNSFITRDKIKGFADQAAQNFLEQAYRDKKYIPELFVDRTMLSDVFASFEQSEKTLFPLLGEAGQGKTNQLCYWTDKLMRNETNNIVLIFDSSGFTESTLEEKLKEIFDAAEDEPVKKILDTIHEKIKDRKENIYFFFDAINECLFYKGDTDSAKGSFNLYSDICSWLIDKNYPCFKVLFTCRSYAWKDLILPNIPEKDAFMFLADDTDEVSVHGFTDIELEQAYAKYTRHYGIGTDFSSLSSSIKTRLKDSLVMKIACINDLSDNMLPDAMFYYTSIELFAKMLDGIKNSRENGKDQYEILKESANYILQKYENRTPVDNIALGDLREAYADEHHPLHKLAKLIYLNNDTSNFSSAGRELFDNFKRPVLRMAEKDNGAAQIQFIYERFLEFMLAVVFVERERHKLPGQAGNIPAATFVNELSGSAANVVFMGAMRNALLMDYIKTGNPSVIIELISKSENYLEAMLLITDAINVLIRENYENEIFALLKQLLSQQPEAGKSLIKRFNTLYKKTVYNQADSKIIEQYNRLYEQLTPIIRLRKIAAISVVNGMFLTDYFNQDEGEYRDKSFELLWMLMTDPLMEVRNETCMYVYYLQKKTHTIEYSIIKENLTRIIVQAMYSKIERKIKLVKEYRKQFINFVELAGRLSILLIIDDMQAENESASEQSGLLLNEIRAAIRNWTGNYKLLKMVLPLLKPILNQQLTFVSMYVNNSYEYKTFWDESLVPGISDNDDQWSRKRFSEILRFISHYNKYYKNQPESAGKGELPDFSKHHPHILSAYNKGDSFSYFMLERIMAIMGICGYKFIRPVINTFFAGGYRNNEWFDYSQMSMLYILFQVSIYNEAAQAEILELYGRESKDWTLRCKGLFKGRQSHATNQTTKTNMYKRNVMTWYCIVYCCHAGDAVARPGDDSPVPVFYELIDEAVMNKDKELLYHLLENISELVTEHGGYIHTALELIKYIMTKFDSEEKVIEFDQLEIKRERSGVYRDDLIRIIGKVLSTAKNCFPIEVERFIRREMPRLQYIGIPKYKSELINYFPSGETLSDLFTHKFGNFVMWSLLNEQVFGECAYKALSVSVNLSGCSEWYDRAVRIIAGEFLDIKL